MAIKTFVLRTGKTILYIICFILCYGLMPKAEHFLNIEVASQWSDVIYGEDNIETLYDLFADVDIVVAFFVTTIIYLFIMKLIKHMRK